ncbi:hypothetical protein AAC387_Pa04g1444 [Persea americana]
MYPIERFLGTLKGYVTNRARPEGSIAEAYIVKEEHRNTIQNPEAHDIIQIQRDTFPKWFKQRMNDLRNQGSPKATNEMWDVHYCRDDIPPEIVNGDEPMSEHSDDEDETMAEYIDDDDEDDPDIDPDIEYDV